LIDFEQRIQGSTYEQVAKAGGGIRSSTEGVRTSSEEDLASCVLRAFRQMQKSGTTTAEAKSGYGLSPDAELKSLRAIHRAAKEWRGTVVPTLLGAHVVPSEFQQKADAYVDVVCNEMIPAAAQEQLAEFVDVFCERGAFNIAQTERIFDAAHKAGLGVRAHVCQFTPQDLSRLARFEVASYDHLDCLTDKDLQALAKQPTISTLLPGASYFLAHSYPMARRLIEAGAAVALATDYNPGTSPTTSMPLVLSLACTQMRMSPAEAISAATINGAHALRLAARKGTIEVGKDADLAIFDVKDFREICYWFGTDICRATVLNGRLNIHQE
jgi:imidazolonepropionase